MKGLFLSLVVVLTLPWTVIGCSGKYGSSFEADQACWKFYKKELRRNWGKNLGVGYSCKEDAASSQVMYVSEEAVNCEYPWTCELKTKILKRFRY